VHYINAGHVPPLLIRSPQEVVPLEAGGTVIGMFDAPGYSRGTVKLQPGDVLLLCTDGVVEAVGPDSEEYGTERMIRLVSQNRSRSAQELVSLVRNDLREFSRSSAQTDDRVLLVLKVLESSGP
jgi:sigma-B regulation protein RsbU (phosphoserine phosphatase)